MVRPGPSLLESELARRSEPRGPLVRVDDRQADWLTCHAEESKIVDGRLYVDWSGKTKAR